MSDEILAELWAVKDEIAREHNYSVQELATHLAKSSGSPRPQAVGLQKEPILRADSSGTV